MNEIRTETNNKTKSETSNINNEIMLENLWKAQLGGEFEKPHMRELKAFLQTEKKQGKVIFPPSSLIFSAFNETPFDKVKVVILGQDPYHGPKQAHGLSFSVPDGVDLPPSLLNIYKELEADLGIGITRKGNLLKWAQQGVLLLNSVLTVEQSMAASHQGCGWEQFTDAAIQALNQHRENIVFILWGSYAQKKAAFVDTKKHFVIKSVHPSPLSSYRGFFGSRPFSKANNYLVSKGLTPINWSLQ